MLKKKKKTKTEEEKPVNNVLNKFTKELNYKKRKRKEQE